MTSTTALPRNALSRVLLAAAVPDPYQDDREETGAVPTVGQRRARARALPVRSRRPDPAGAQARLASWVPVLPEAAVHAPLLRLLAAKAEPVDSADAAELLTALASMAAWLHRCGLTVDETTLTDPALVQRWALVALEGMTAGSSANYRARVARVAAAVRGAVPAPAPMHRSDGCEPYTRAEEDVLLHWARQQRTPRLRDDLTAVLGLGMGAGLSTAETLGVRAGGLAASPDGALAAQVAGPRARTVPVLPRWAPVLAAAARGLADDEFLVRPGDPGRRGKNAVSNLVAAALREGGTPTADPELRPVPQRMRATFLLRHLQARTRADVLLAVAGLDGLGALDRYLPALARQDADADGDIAAHGDGAGR